jgi:hypothetical protein
MIFNIKLPFFLKWDQDPDPCETIRDPDPWGQNSHVSGGSVSGTLILPDLFGKSNVIWSDRVRKLIINLVFWCYFLCYKLLFLLFSRGARWCGNAYTSPRGTQPATPSPPTASTSSPSRTLGTEHTPPSSYSIPQDSFRLRYPHLVVYRPVRMSPGRNCVCPPVAWTKCVFLYLTYVDQNTR